MKDRTVRVTLINRGHFRDNDRCWYQIEKVTGAIVLEVKTGNEYAKIRVGEMITEDQAVELSSRDNTEVTTLPYKG